MKTQYQYVLATLLVAGAGCSSENGQQGTDGQDVGGSTSVAPKPPNVPGLNDSEAILDEDPSSSPGMSGTPGAALDDVTDFEGNPITTAIDFESCGGVTQEAESVIRPVDVIVVIDNSSSMADEIEAVEQRVNESLGDILDAAKLDYRVILVSAYRDLHNPADFGVCIGGKLGGRTCKDERETLTHNEPVFFHFDVPIDSKDGMCRLFDSWERSASEVREVIFEEFDYTQPDPGEQISPGGLKSLLREESTKSFIFITDDAVNCEVNDKLAPKMPSGEPLELTLEFEDAAAAFDDALLELAPAYFGTADDRRYTVHSIIGITGNEPADEAWLPEAAVTNDKCETAVRPGVGYQTISKMTEGLRWPVCETSTFDVIFRAISGQVEQGALSCSWDIPETKDMLDPTKVNLLVSEGGPTRKLASYVGSAADCQLGGWYYDDPNMPSKVVACPETCDVIKSTPKVRVEVVFGCGQFVPETVR